jgi:cyd operon protein YbgT
MWYFRWVLGLGLAACFSMLNAMWFEVMAGQREHAARDSDRS